MDAPCAWCRQILDYEMRQGQPLRRSLLEDEMGAFPEWRLMFNALVVNKTKTARPAAVQQLAVDDLPAVTLWLRLSTPR